MKEYKSKSRSSYAKRTALNCKHPYEYRIKICPASMCPNKERHRETRETSHDWENQLDRELSHLASKQDVAKVPERFEGRADFTMSFRLRDFFSAFVRCLGDPATLWLAERH